MSAPRYTVRTDWAFSAFAGTSFAAWISDAQQRLSAISWHHSVEDAVRICDALNAESASALDDLRDVTECLRNERKRFAELLAERDEEIVRLRAPFGDVSVKPENLWRDLLDRAIAARPGSGREGETGRVSMKHNTPLESDIKEQAREIVRKYINLGVRFVVGKYVYAEDIKKDIVQYGDERAAAAREAAIEEAALVCMSTDWPDPEEICNAIRALAAKPGSAG